MRNTRNLLGLALTACLVAAGLPASAQDRTETVLGSWRVIVQPPVPRTIVAFSICNAETTAEWDSWRFTLVRDANGLSAEIWSRRFRPQNRRFDVLSGTIGEESVRFEVQWELPASSARGWGLALRILDQDAFRLGMARGGRLRIATPEGDMDWPTEAGAEVLSAFHRCTW